MGFSNNTLCLSTVEPHYPLKIILKIVQHSYPKALQINSEALLQSSSALNHAGVDCE